MTPRPCDEARPTVSVIIPVHDNAGTLLALQQRLSQAFAGERLQIVIVDDASTDGSLELARALPVEVVSLRARVGQNGAILAGLAQARGILSCVLDADLQDPPEAMPALIARLRRRDVQVVFSSRLAPFRLSSRLFRGVARAVFPNLPRTPCLCFAVDDATRSALLRVARSPDYLVAVIGALGVTTASVPVVRARPTPDGRRGLRGLHRYRYAARMLRSTMTWRWRASWSRIALGGGVRSVAVRAVRADADERARPPGSG